MRCCLTLLFAILPTLADAQPVKPERYQGLRWRMIGPFRAGRTVGAAGVPGQPNVFYIGVNNGGVWKTTDYGHTWRPLFDDQPTGSIGALAVAPSDPMVIYVGSGEGLQRPDLSTGNGVYKTTDGGKSWVNTGLRDGQQIGAVLVHPRDPNRVYVAVLGHPYGANTERGVFRTTNGGKTWEKVLYRDENTGAIALAFDPKNPDVIYADLWAARQGPWENGAWQGTGSGLYKSTDGGTTWKQLTRGLPTIEQGLGRIGFDVAASHPNRLYAVVDAPRLGGLYRSEDAGESWKRINSDPRLWGRGSDFAEVKVDPKNEDVVYVANIGFYKSTDGGATVTCIKAAPGGDDYHTIWINPDHPEILLLATDQGATITVNGGESWSSWYNQPTAQFYHVSTDNQFPYWVYGGQQESGSAGVCSRGRDGHITFRDWHPVGVEEYGYVAPDPLDPNIIYGGKITRFDRRTGQMQSVAPEAIRTGKYRFLRTAPVLFAPTDPHTLYFAGNVLFKTSTGGRSWEVISPDLSREQTETPESIGIFRTPQMADMPRRGVIYTVAPSYWEGNVLWAGTDDGLIHVTRDGGKHWENVTPSGLTAWSKVSLIDAGRHDPATAYAAINRIRLDDQKPHVYRTHDFGKTWKEIVKGLPEDAPVNAVREDSVRKGLLFCGTERAIHVSFNDGDDWQSLRLNMPATSMRDLVVHHDDLVVGTHGRGFWILDDISPLRQIDVTTARGDTALFKPQVAYRVRWNVNTDTPLPPEEPAGQNPPDGAILYYHLDKKPAGPVVLEVREETGRLVRRYSSEDKAEPVRAQELQIATYWIRPHQVLSAEPGMHRFVWDLRFAPLPGRRSYPMTAIYGDTPSEPHGPWVLPGRYTVTLTVDGRTFSQELVIKMDPRVTTPEEGLRQQHAIAMRCYDGMAQLQDIQARARRYREQVSGLREKDIGDLNAALTGLDEKLGPLAGPSPAGGGRPGRGRQGGAAGGIAALSGQLGAMQRLVEGADVAPTTQAVAAAARLDGSLREALERWRVIQEDVKQLNERLKAKGLSGIG